MRNDKALVGRTLLSSVGAFAILAATVAASGCLGTDEPQGTEGATTEGTEGVTTKQDPLFGIFEYDDTPGMNVCNGMHCCGSGYGMRGIHIGANTLRCVRIWNSTDSGCFPDNTTIRDGMKACPIGTYMKGYHGGTNTLTCCPYPSNNVGNVWTINGNSSSIWLPEMNAFDPPETATAETKFNLTMHVCPNSGGSDGYRAMEGIHAGNNDFICAQ